MNQIARGDHELSLIETARRVLPAGGFGNVSTDIVIREGRGSHVWDVSGNEYVDYLIGSGPMFAGHAHPDITAAVREQVERGTTFFVNNEHGIRLAAEIVDAVRCAEQVRFVSSGSEADAYALRLARAFRKRDKILKFEGGYHGMSDWGLMSLSPKRPGNFPQPVPDSAGIPASVRNEVLVAAFNDAEMAASLIAEHHEELACVIVEPLQRLLPPAPGFLETLRRVTEQYGVLLVFDEVVTGFRLAYGGAQEVFGVTPDICTLGKIIGGGFPLAAIAGRADIMAHFDRALAGDDGFLMQVGTLSGNPVAAVAGLATLDVLRRDGVYAGVETIGRALIQGMEEIVRRKGIPAQVVGAPCMFDVVFADGDIRDYRGMLRGDADRQRRVNAKQREMGILKSESKYYLSIAHDQPDVDRTLTALKSAVSAE